MKEKGNIIVEQVVALPMDEESTELVERKGVGHPDSICDAVMDAVSVAIAFVDRFIPDAKTYFERKAAIGRELLDFVRSHAKKIGEIRVDINTLDDPMREKAASIIERELAGIKGFTMRLASGELAVW